MILLKKTRGKLVTSEVKSKYNTFPKGILKRLPSQDCPGKVLQFGSNEVKIFKVEPQTSESELQNTQTDWICFRKTSFDGWFKLHIFDAEARPLHNFIHLLQARAGAIWALGEGLIFSTITTIKYLFAAIFRLEKCATYRRKFGEQWHGNYLSAIAIFTPNDAGRKFIEYWKGIDHSTNPRTYYPIDPF